jgi:lipid-A-disaccharide synthase
MHIFVSAGEPSGDLHGSNLIQALHHAQPDLLCSGFGGERMESAGAKLLYPMANLSVMWFPHVLKSVDTFLSLLKKADRFFRVQRPDALVMIDYPGFHWWLARKARKHGIPVFYFVPPQMWAWAGWRVQKIRRFVDHVVCSLPFEPAWYRQHGVTAHYFGHPYFDALARQTLDQQFLSRHDQQGDPIVAVLPGSRKQEIAMNFPSFVKAMRIIHACRPKTRFVVASFNEEQRSLAANHLLGQDLPVELHAGKTKEIIRLADACMSVSGSVGLELLHGGLPSVVAYRIPRHDAILAKLVMKTPYISLVNLLAGEELFPEFLSVGCRAEGIAEQILQWLDRPSMAQWVRAKLAALKQRVAFPGACRRTADFILDQLDREQTRKAA